jgi:hypothetical protein
MHLIAPALLALLAAIPPDEEYISNCGVEILIAGESAENRAEAGHGALIVRTPQPATLYIPRSWPRGVRWEKWVDGEWSSVWPNKDPVWSEWGIREFRTGEGRLMSILYDDVMCTNPEGKNIIPAGRYRYILYFFRLDPRVTKTGLTQWCVARSESFERDRFAGVLTLSHVPDTRVFPPCESP